MRKLILCILALLSLAGGIKLQAYLGQQKPGSSVIELCPLTTISAPFAAGNVPAAPDPLGIRIPQCENAIAVVKIQSMPTPFQGQFLNVHFQSSADDGQTWNDFAIVTFGGAGASAPATYYVPISLISPGSPAVSAIIDGDTNAGDWNKAAQGPLGNLVRVKYFAWFGGPTPATGVYSFQAYLMCQ
jgi:hypothetical protein